MPLSLDAFSSSTASLMDAPKSCLQRENAVTVVVVGQPHVGVCGAPGERQDGRGLSHARRTRDNDVGDVSFSGEHGKPLDSFWVADDFTKRLGTVFLDPGNVLLRLGTGHLDTVT